MAKIKICLDAGHYGKYNQSPAVRSYYESEMNWKLHLLLKKYLEQYGIEVITTRADQTKDLGTYNRGMTAKGCDLFISIHSNAVGSNVNESVDYPLAIVPIDGSGDAIGKKLANCVRDVMGTTQPADMWSKKRDDGKNWYGVIYGANLVGVTGIILEHSFHTQTRAANWLSVDSNLDKMAQAEAKVIAEHFGVSKKTESTSNTEAVKYRVQIGAYSDKANAETMLAKAKAAGFADAFIVEERTEAAAPVQKPEPVQPVQPVKKSVDEIAKEVINGNWGNGADRKNRLTEAGYDYSAVQKRVNEMLK